MMKKNTSFAGFTQVPTSESKGFTLIETMVAISILMVAIVAPMSLAAQSLSAAYYARDQITAFYLAQEGIEVVRSVRDTNILKIAGSLTVLLLAGFIIIFIRSDKNRSPKDKWKELHHVG